MDKLIYCIIEKQFYYVLGRFNGDYKIIFEKAGFQYSLIILQRRLWCIKYLKIGLQLYLSQGWKEYRYSHFKADYLIKFKEDSNE